MSARPSSRTVIIAGAVALVISMAGCGSSKKKDVSAPSSAPPTSASATPTVSKAAVKPAATVNPLTGIGPVPTGPVIAVKIDDTANGRPQRGVDQADVVYVETAEGGLTRTVQVFASKKPIVEAVRSVRDSDPELLSQYGHIALVASGGGGDSLTTLHSSIITGVIDNDGDGFSRDGNRGAPYNLEDNLAVLSGDLHTAGVQNIGFHFAASDPRVNAAPVGTSISQVVGSTPITFVWNAAKGIYVRTLDGTSLTAADGAPVGAANVIIQFCQVSTDTNDVDVNGNPSQYTHSVGTGKAVLYRNGRMLVGTWSRPTPTSPTTFVDSTGKVLDQSPGSTYVLLANA
jgi:hypothetical protein